MIGRRSSRRDPFHVPLNRAAPSARQAMLLAYAEASWLHHPYLGTEHLLIGAAREATGAAILARVGVTADAIRAETLKLIGNNLPADEPPPAPPPGSVPTPNFTDRARHALRLAAELAVRGRREAFGVEHVLAAILRENEGVAAAVLNNLRVSPDDLRIAILAGSAPAPAPAAPTHGLAIDEQSELSIFEQLVSQVKEGVATGRLRPGQRLPSVRALADQLDIAPGTVARAYAELERLAVVVTEGARGTRIAQPAKAARSDAARPENLAGLLRPVVVAAFHLGATAADLRDALERAMSGILDGGDDDDAAGVGALVPA